MAGVPRLLLVIGLLLGDDTDMEQEEDRQDGAPALVLGADTAPSSPSVGSRS